ncbi:MAG: hypothetical protein PUG21_03840 [Prevotella sp.]|nr:hypothetical protein [Prevotella sp.]
MTRISIFVAGAKNLKTQRLLLKALANDLNDEYARKGYDTQVVMKSYENFGDRQEDYNEYIENEADLVLFVIEERIGYHTENEFKLAAKKQNKSGKPKVKVFLKSFEERTEDINHVENLMNSLLGSFYIEYKNNEELVLKAKERIRTYVRFKTRQERRNIAARIKNNRKPIMASLASVALASVVIFLVCLGYFRVHYPNQLIQFAGGGSVYNFLKENIGFDINDDPRFIYSNMPSGVSWALLREDMWTKNRDSYDNLNNSNRLFTISLSASKMRDSILTKFYLDNKYKGTLCELFLGKDSMVVWIPNRPEKFPFLNKGKTITVSELKGLLADKSLTCFVTSYDSGTRNTYGDILGNRDFLPKKYKNIYNETDEEKDFKIFNNNYFILGSKYYKPSWCKNDPSITSLTVVDDKDRSKAYCKNMFIYFNLYKIKVKEGSTTTIYTIPKVVRKFLAKALKARAREIERLPKEIVIKESFLDGGFIAPFDSIMKHNVNHVQSYTSNNADNNKKD